MVYKFFDKQTGSKVTITEQLANKLHKPVIKTLKKKSLQDLTKTFGKRLCWNGIIVF